MQGDEIALGKELFQRNRLNIEEHGPFGRQEWIVGDDAHAKRLKALEEENRQLKRLVADQALNLQVVKDLLGKKW